MQEALLKTFRHASSIREPEAFRPWLYRTVRNACLMRRRRRVDEPSHFVSLDELLPTPEGLMALDPPDPGRSPEDAAMNGRLRRRMAQGVPRPAGAVSAGGVSARDGGALHARGGGRAEDLRGEREDPSPPRPACSSGASWKEARMHSGRSCRDLVAAISDYIDGELTATRCRDLEAHLAECPCCDRFTDSLRRAVAVCRAAGETRLPKTVQRAGPGQDRGTAGGVARRGVRPPSAPARQRGTPRAARGAGRRRPARRCRRTRPRRPEVDADRPSGGRRALRGSSHATGQQKGRASLPGPSSSRAGG